MRFISWDQSSYRSTGVPEADDELKFDVYQRYIQNWSEFIKGKYPDYRVFASTFIVKTSSLNKRIGNIDINYIKKCLSIAWNTEYLLSFNEESPNTDILRVNNQWKSIQAYYSIYSSAEAAISSLDHKIESHAGCIQKISEFFVQRRDMKDFQPWCFAFTGYEGNKTHPKTIQGINFPMKLMIPNALKRFDIDPIQSIGCCLRAEHRNRIEDWEKPKRSKEMKYLYDPGPTTFFHFLYRLRRKSNYEEAELFMVEAPEEKIKAFSSNLTFLVYVTNTLFEIVTIRKIGKDKFLEMANNFLRRNKNAPIAKRKQEYETLM